MPASWDNYSVNYRPATEADIFAAFEAGAQEEDYIEIADAPFGPEMSLYNWAVANGDDFNRWDAFSYLRRWLIDTYQANIDLREWRSFVRKPKQTTLSDVCRFVVKHGACVLDPKPLSIAGRSCEEAGVFLTLRTAMCNATGRQPSLTPSSSIDQFAQSDRDYFMKLLCLTCPQLTSRLDIKCSELVHPIVCTLLILMPMGYMSFIMSYTGITFFTLSWHIWVCVFISLLFPLLLTAYMPPRSIEIKGLETMADLSREIVRINRQANTA